jgi:hypothetical protein
VWGHINPGGVEMQYKIAGINPQLEHHHYKKNLP